MIVRRFHSFGRLAGYFPSCYFMSQSHADHILPNNSRMRCMNMAFSIISLVIHTFRSIREATSSARSFSRRVMPRLTEWNISPLKIRVPYSWSGGSYFSWTFDGWDWRTGAHQRCLACFDRRMFALLPRVVAVYRSRRERHLYTVHNRKLY